MTKQTVFDRITATIVAKLEAGVMPWRKTWKGGNADTDTIGMVLPRNATTGRAYNGINRLVLMLEAIDKGYTSNLWITPNQCKKHGLDFRGTKTTEVVLWKPTRYKDKDTGKEKDGMFARSFRVLNLDQVQGDKSQFEARDVVVPEYSSSEMADALREGLGLQDVQHAGDRAFYSPQFDLIKMPPVEAFVSEGCYQATLLHEAGHATGHKSRLDRDLMTGRFGDEAYAFEELVAELTAAFTSEVLGVEGENIDNHASYIDNWLRVLKGDSKAIQTAASKAQAAATMVLDALGVQVDGDTAEEVQRDKAA